MCANLREWVTFLPNKNKPIHDWFYYKEGFSSEFVKWGVSEFGLKEPVFDPFCGSGTTLLTCKELGLQSIGSDISPLACLVSRAKTQNHDLKVLQKELHRLQALSVSFDEIVSLDARIRKLFYKETLQTIWFYKKQVEKISDKKVKEFFLLALIDAMQKSANVVKVGGSLRKQKKRGVNVRKFFFEKAKKMIDDLKKTKLSNIEPLVLKEDARSVKLKPESIGSVITSPPYLNKLEYTTAFKLELGVFFGYKSPRLEKFLGDKENAESVFLHLPKETQAYFSDLKLVLENLFVALKPGGRVVFNVAGACFPSGPFQVDKEFERIAQNAGFLVIQNIEARKVPCNAHRSKKQGFARDVVIVLQKE